MIRFLERFSGRTITLLYTAAALAIGICCVVIFVKININSEHNDECAWLPVKTNDSLIYITRVKPGGVTAMAGVQDGDTLISINKKRFVFGQAMSLINQVRSGSSAVYHVKRGNTELDLNVRIIKVVNPLWIALFIMSMAYLIIGVVAIRSKPKGELQQRFANYCFATGFVFTFAFNGSVRLIAGNIPLVQTLIFISAITLLIYALPQQIQFFFHFPVRRKAADNVWLRRGLYVLSIFTIIGTFVTNIRFGSHQVEVARIVFAIMGGLSQILVISFYPAGLFTFTESYFNEIKKNERRPLRPILIGFSIAILAIIYFIVIQVSVPFALYTKQELLLPVILFAAPPITLGYAIFRYGLMDISIIVERSIIFAVVTTVVAASYLLIVSIFSTFIGGVIAGLFGLEGGFSNNLGVTIVAFVILALMIEPIKRKTEDWVAKLFYQERINYQKALLELSRELPGLINFTQIVDALSVRLRGTMHLERLAIMLNEERFTEFEPPELHENALPALGDESGSLFDELQQQKSPLYIEHHPNPVSKKQRDENIMHEKHIVLAVPMLVKEEVIGVIAVGKKRSGKGFSQEDIDLLMTVASQAAIAFENARLHESEVQKQKMEDSLALARRIQQGLLPKSPPVVHGLDVSGVSLPAEIVGGDFYDLIRLSPTRLLVVVGDVSGKGMSAALYMSKIQGMMQLAAHSFTTPKEMLIHVNRHIFEGMERNTYVTMVLALFDTEERVVHICRAGHTKPLMVTAASTSFISSKGLGIGLTHSSTFEKCIDEVTIPLQESSSFVFFSDGLNEAINSKREEFGTEVLCNVVNVFRTFPSQTIQDNLVQAVSEFRGDSALFDDLTIVVVKVTGTETNVQSDEPEIVTVNDGV